jgi:hypothetical protein
MLCAYGLRDVRLGRAMAKLATHVQPAGWRVLGMAIVPVLSVHLALGAIGRCHTTSCCTFATCPA